MSLYKSVAVMATLRVRADTASIVVSSISPQVDKVCIVLNKVGDEDINEWKSFFKELNIEFYVRNNQMGDAERYIPVTEKGVYYLSIDDDLIYPLGYVDNMISGCEKYNGPVSMHGKFFPTYPVTSYIRQNNALYYQCRHKLVSDYKIHTPGCCVVCWKQDQIDLSYKQFRVKNRSDIEVGRIAAENGISIMCLSHDPLEYVAPAGKTIWEEETSTDNPEIVRAINEVLSIYFAKESLNKKDYFSASKFYEEYLKVCNYPQLLADAWLMIARCRMNLNMNDLAKDACLQAIKLNANFKEAELFMAELSGPGNRKRWLQIAETASNEAVYFVR